jgi:hypothetical protein
MLKTVFQVYKACQIVVQSIKGQNIKFFLQGGLGEIETK